MPGQSDVMYAVIIPDDCGGFRSICAGPSEDPAALLSGDPETPDAQLVKFSNCVIDQSDYEVVYIRNEANTEWMPCIKPKAPMPKFRFARSVEAAQGTQWFTVEAASLDEAKDLANAGKMTFEDEEVEVTELGKPYFVEEVEPDV